MFYVDDGQMSLWCVKTYAKLYPTLDMITTGIPLTYDQSFDDIICS